MTIQFLMASITACLLFAIYLPACLFNQWLSFQDAFVVTQNPAVIHGQSVFSTSIVQGIWMPLTLLIYRIQFLLVGLNPVVFHLTNVVIHVLGVVCIGLIATRLTGRTRSVWFGVLCYGLLPWHASQVAGVWGLSDVLTNALMALIIFAFIKYIHKRRGRWLVTLISASVLLLLTKPFIGMLNNLLMMIIATGCVALSVLAKRFDDFLKTQEQIIRWLFIVALVLLVITLAVFSFNKCGWWRNDKTLWSHVVKEKPSVVAYLNYAKVLQQEIPSNSSPKLIDDILSCYAKASILDGKNADVYLEKATFLIRLRDVEGAKGVYEKLMSIHAHQPQALIGLAQIYIYQQQSSKVIELINDLVNHYPEDEGMFLKAISLFTKAVGIFPQEKIYQEKREELLSALDELSKRKQYTAVDFFNLAMLYQQVGGKDEAIRYYRKALLLNANHIPSLTNLALLMQVSGESKTALTLYEKLIHLRPTFVAGYLNMGLIYSSMGDFPHARQMFLKTIQLHPASSEAFFNLGYIHENQGDVKQAGENYEKAIELDPTNAEAYYNLGNVYAAQGLMAEAIASYLKTVELNPKHVNAYVNLSIISYKSRDMKGAIAYLEKARALGYTPPEAFLKTLVPYMKK